jgi:hypothetical protein
MGRHGRHGGDEQETSAQNYGPGFVPCQHINPTFDCRDGAFCFLLSGSIALSQRKMCGLKRELRLELATLSQWLVIGLLAGSSVGVVKHHSRACPPLTLPMTG